MRETSKTRRVWGSLEEAVLQGRGLDIGGGPDSLPNARRFDLEDGDVGKRLGVAKGLGTIGCDVAGIAQIAQQLLELDALVALEAEGTGDLALADRRGAVVDEGQQFVSGRDAPLSHRSPCAAAWTRTWPPWAS